MLPANFIERRQSVKEITCDLIQIARAGASRTGRWWEVRATRAEMGAVGVVGAVGEVGIMRVVGIMGGMGVIGVVG